MPPRASAHDYGEEIGTIRCCLPDLQRIGRRTVRTLNPRSASGFGIVTNEFAESNAMIGTSVAQSAGTAGVRPAASRVADAPVAPNLVVPVQPVGDKRASLPRVGAEGTGGMGGEAAVCSYPIGTSFPQVFKGRTVDYIEERRRHKKAKLIVTAFHSLHEIGRHEQAVRLLSCGRWFQRFNFPCGTYKLVPYHCDSPFCPNCANRKARPLRKKLAVQIQQSKYDYWHLTITVENWPTLTRKALSKLIGQFAKLRDTTIWQEWVLGGLYSLETTFNASQQTWHPHFHVLIETPKRLPREWIFKLRDCWRDLTGSHVMHLERMYGVDKKGRKTRKINHRSLCEIVKYATKAASFADLPEHVGEFLDAFHSVRRVQSFGSFLRAHKESENELERNPVEHVGCSCGLCTWKAAQPAGLVHIKDTFLTADGTRQLRLFDSGTDPPKPPPFEDSIPEETYVAQLAREEARRQVVLFQSAQE